MKQNKKVRMVRMKKVLSKILKFFGNIFKFLYKILDVILITPLSKFFYWIADGLSNKNALDRLLNNSNTLIYFSLFCAFAVFFAVDRKVIDLSDTEAIVLSNQAIKAEYNEEARIQLLRQDRRKRR